MRKNTPYLIACCLLLLPSAVSAAHLSSPLKGDALTPLLALRRSLAPSAPQIPTKPLLDALQNQNPILWDWLLQDAPADIPTAFRRHPDAQARIGPLLDLLTLSQPPGDRPDKNASADTKKGVRTLFCEGAGSSGAPEMVVGDLPTRRAVMAATRPFICPIFEEVCPKRK